MKNLHNAAIDFTQGLWDRFLRVLHRRPLWAFAAIVLFVCAAASIVLFIVEREGAHPVWRTVVYMLSGIDVDPPETLIGEYAAAFALLSGVIIVSLLTGYVASEFSRLMSSAGSVSRKPSGRTFEDHIVIFGWNAKSKAILRELSADFSNRGFLADEIVVVSEKPTLERGVDSIYQHVWHVQGNSTDPDVLKRANLTPSDSGKGAHVAVVLGDSSLPPEEADRRSLLTLLAVEHLHPAVISLVDVFGDEVATHFKNANADEVLVPNHYGSLLLARAAEFPGLTSYIDELLSLASDASEFGGGQTRAPISFYVERAEKLGIVGRGILDAVFHQYSQSGSIIAGLVAEGGVTLYADLLERSYVFGPGDSVVTIAAPKVS